MFPHPLARRLFKEARAFLWPLLLVGVVKSSLGSVNFVPTGSMEPTVLVGDALFVNHLAYGLRLPFTMIPLARWADPVRGDIVTCFEPGKGTRLVKRVAGTPGDRIELRNDVLFVNGERAFYSGDAANQHATLPSAEQPQAIVARETAPGGRNHAVMILLRRLAWRNFGPITVPAGSYFLMGDNRDNSEDSRYFGAVPRSQVIGRAQSVALSFDPEHYYLPRLQRSFTALQ